MALLSITLIDVGWGDSILIESETNQGDIHYALIDCNDTTKSRSSYLFLKRFFERKRFNPNNRRYFDFVLLSHGHADHGSGIQAIMRDFPTDWFWYPKSVEFGSFAKILRYANRYQQKVARHQSIDQTKNLPSLGDVQLSAMWPPNSGNQPHDSQNENNNSVVLRLTLGNVSFVLTADCEADNWPQFLPGLVVGNQRIAAFQSPHHGAENGLFDANGQTPWLDALGNLPHMPIILMSSHIRPHNHPAPQVTTILDNQNREYLRTDIHYHVTVRTDGTLNQNGSPNTTIEYTR